MQRTRFVALAAAALMGTALIGPLQPANATPTAKPTPTAPGLDDRASVASDIKAKLPKSAVGKYKKQGGVHASSKTENEVGDEMGWLALDGVTGQAYLKDYTLQALGSHIQVWVASDTSFPDGDCRNDLGLADVTQAQAKGFIKEFDKNIYPKESKSFSVAPARDGSKALLAGQLGEDYFKTVKSQADDTVVLVDNVQDENFTDPGTPEGQTYIAGFFSSTFNEYADRNIMTIDAYDWLHRTGANPPDDSDDQAYIDCAAELGLTRPMGGSNPRLYEGTFAHEYQHLLEYYEDTDEVSWVNEGLSDYAQSLVGYVNTKVAPDKPAADGHLACYSGYMDPSFGGPENSLTLWEDQGGPEVLCDYGAAYSFMTYLYSHYGEKFMTNLHRHNANGLAGLDKVLDKAGSKKSARATFNDWLVSTAVDGALDANGKIVGASAARFQAKYLRSKINWSNPQAYDSPGAPPNGADYVQLRSGSSMLKAKDLTKIQFQGEKTLAPDEVEWTAEATPPDATTDDTACGAVEAGTGDAALYSGCGENMDRSIAQLVTVPAEGGTLSFDALWDIEEGWDFGFVQVSEDGGKTWKSLATQDTTTEADPSVDASTRAMLPGFSGDSGEWKTETADLSAYAGKDILVGFRYVTDPAVNEGGMWIRNVEVAGTSLATDSVDGWQTYSQISPEKIPGWTVQLIGINGQSKVWYTRLPLDGDFKGTLSGKKRLARLFGNATTVAALVTMNDDSESITKYGGYTLTVNGEAQPGGS